MDEKIFLNEHEADVFNEFSMRPATRHDYLSKNFI